MAGGKLPSNHHDIYVSNWILDAFGLLLRVFSFNNIHILFHIILTHKMVKMKRYLPQTDQYEM